MKSLLNDSLRVYQRMIAFVAVVVASVVIPALMIRQTTKTIFSTKPLGTPNRKFMFFAGTIENGELWHCGGTHLGQKKQGQNEYRLHRLNVHDGTDLETALIFPEIVFPIWNDNQLYAVSLTSVYKVEKSGVVKCGSMPSRKTDFWSWPFIYDNYLTIIVYIDGGEFQLRHFADGQWIEGRKVRLPVPPSTDESDVATEPTGFELVENNETVSSALTPSNTVRRIESDEPVHPTWIGGRGFHTAWSRGGAIYVKTTPLPFSISFQHPNGTWSKLDTSVIPNALHPGFVAVDRTNDATYLFNRRNDWCSAQIHLIRDGKVEPLHATLPGNKGQYLHWWQQFLRTLTLSWFVHVFILTCGVVWLARNQRLAIFAGLQQAQSASILRRALGLIADLMVGSALFGILMFAELQIIGLQPRTDTLEEVAESLFDIEMLVDSGWEYSPAALLFLAVVRMNRPIGKLVTAIAPIHPSLPTLSMLITVNVLLIYGLRLLMDRVWQISPGSWLFGTRVVHTSLRPTETSRTIMRDVIGLCELSLFLSPLPAAISVMLSRNGCRIGDLLADTIVVDANSIRVIDSVRDMKGPILIAQESLS